MKKFSDAKAPLTMLKLKMQLKAQKMDTYTVFKDELEVMCEEQGTFFESCEMEVAVADTIDPVQVITFQSIHLSFPT